ncbi:DNA starvation/stationary phase protection protein [Gordonia sp. ABSL49_1]|uniref:Dps family protein n=1 Tax=unclassified Gordonia (in: high G+C Gram-positive bacteria) TaxID=2657482 RepID=UPI001F0FF945|nr:DNA starvation/stationary phase protection protein [Gordonia sp. ABSL49_1]MCH5643379.1 DNA starvation/stationary phase protection protein [Gordonia sp. ABSL49_1]
MTSFTAPGLSADAATEVTSILQERLSALNDLHLTLKHIHWNVVGANFIGVHEMIDPQVELVRGYADTVAERIATLGASPNGTAKAIEDDRSWSDYSIGRDTAQAHLGALDLVYDGFVGSHRDAIAKTGDLDPITEDILIGQTAELEKFQWFVRAHLESYSGELANAGATSESAAADAARTAGADS